MHAIGLHVLPGQENRENGSRALETSRMESRFRLVNVDGKLRIWCQAHEAMDPARQVGTVQDHRVSVTVWGVFSCQFLGSLVLVPTILNEIWYVELLSDHLHPFMLYCHSQ